MFNVDIDGWREGGKSGKGWNVVTVERRLGMESESDSDSESDGQGSIVGEKELQSGESDDEVDLGPSDQEGVGSKRKRKSKTVTIKSKRSKTSARSEKVAKTGKSKRLAHPKSSTSHLPLSVLLPDQLPKDPYERALRLLHVGATPESLPCREEEYVDVLSRVEEGVEGGGGGCLCEFLLTAKG